jgi:SET domain-containing protein
MYSLLSQTLFFFQKIKQCDRLSEHPEVQALALENRSLFTVQAHEAGNLTRFFNHSCARE